MLADRLHHWFIPKTSDPSEGQKVFWFTLSLVISLTFSWLYLREAFSGNYIVQDDARQHVFWMQRFIDPELFPDDYIADYFQSVAPWGYSQLYRLFSLAWISPWWVNKLLPAILGLITTAYCYGLTVRIINIPVTGFLAALLLNQSVWMDDDLVSATPRAFVYPLFLAVLYYLAGTSQSSFITRLILTPMAIALLGLFYPSYVLITLGILILQVIHWQGEAWQKRHQGWSWQVIPLRVSNRRQDYLFYGLCLLVGIGILIAYSQNTSDYNPVITAEGARDWIELSPEGRSPFFWENPWKYFLLGQRSGLLHTGLVRPATLVLAILFPIFIAFPKRFSLQERLAPSVWLLPQVLGVGIVGFIAAHIFLFRLHLPARYTEHTSRIVFALATAIAITLLIDWFFHAVAKLRPNAAQGKALEPFLAIAALILLTPPILLYPAFVEDFLYTQYKEGTKTDLYAFLQEQPKDSLVASLSSEADFIPTFAQRSVVVAQEYAIPYHWGYYQNVRERAVDLITAQYSPDATTVKNAIEKYSIDLWVLDRYAFLSDYPETSWFYQYRQPANEAIAILQQDEQTPFIETHQETCSIFKSQGMDVLDANCLITEASDDQPSADSDQ